MRPRTYSTAAAGSSQQLAVSTIQYLQTWLIIMIRTHWLPVVVVSSKQEPNEEWRAVALRAARRCWLPGKGGWRRGSAQQAARQPAAGEEEHKNKKAAGWEARTTSRERRRGGGTSSDEAAAANTHSIVVPWCC